MSTAEDQYLFVYGTLRRGLKGPGRRILAKFANFVGYGTFRGKLYDTGRFPAAIRSDNPEDKVKGEIYRLNQTDELLKTLDSYEGYDPDAESGSLFIRAEAEVQTEQEETIQAWIYLYNRPIDHCQAVPSGDYLSHLEKQ